MAALDSFIVLLISIFCYASEGASHVGSWKVIQLYGKPEHGYYFHIFLGTPPQKLGVVVDTGSANFAVAGNSTAGVDTFFDSSKSLSFTSHTENAISVRYSNGSWNGFFASDNISICESCGLSSRVDLALITTSTNFFVSRDLWQGILGLGYSVIYQPNPSFGVPVFDSLYSDNVISTQTFSITLCGQENRNSSELHGTLEFDAHFDGYFTYTKIVREWYYQIELTNLTVDSKSLQLDCSELNSPVAFIDTGTTNIVLPSPVYANTVAQIEEFAEQFNRSELSNGTLKRFLSRTEFLCVAPANQSAPIAISVFDWFPELHVFFAANSTHQFSINIPPEQYIRQNVSSMQELEKFEVKTYCYTFAIESGEIGTILGSSFMERLNVVHDRENKRIGFSVDSTTCKVTDPEFEKKISDIIPRDRSELSCIPPSKHRPPLPSLFITFFIFLSVTLFIVGVFFQRTRLLKFTRTLGNVLCCRWCGEPEYSYMMNSEEEDDLDEEYILRDDEELDGDEVNLGYPSSARLQLQVDHDNDDGT